MKTLSMTLPTFWIMAGHVGYQLHLVLTRRSLTLRPRPWEVFVSAAVGLTAGWAFHQSFGAADLSRGDVLVGLVPSLLAGGVVASFLSSDREIAARA